ncbi:MAG: glycosyltransferase family 2 protein [Flavobacteriales bacterium]|nr:glycosyltransferase family 2 protein [Flavobacteriales bacterium]
MEPLVSIIMPAYNSEHYIEEAIASVIAQSHTNWQLLVVNDGSRDRTAEILLRYHDPRIEVFHQANGGIGNARNKGLAHVRGEFVCFLDSDDVLPANSIGSRIAIFQRYPDTDMVDGRVVQMDKDLRVRLKEYVPTFTGQPFAELVRLTGSCFAGITWMVRWRPGATLRFNEETSHMEDMLFCLEYSPGRTYRYTLDTVLIYRRTGHSSMSDLDGLWRSYRFVYRWIEAQGIIAPEDLRRYRMRSRSIMVKSFLRAGRPLKAFKTLFDRIGRK